MRLLLHASFITCFIAATALLTDDTVSLQNADTTLESENAAAAPLRTPSKLSTGNWTDDTEVV
jgi:hypothetical protein